MQINPHYLETFAVPIDGKPVEVPLNGYEQFANNAVSIDDADGTYLAVNYYDDYPSDQQWLIQPGTDKRKTFVIAKRGADVVGAVGYEFSGLITLEDLRAWYRAKFDIIDPVQLDIAAAAVVAAE